MTRTNHKDQIEAQTTTPEAEAMLRDMAFVLKMTRQVKQEMLRDVGSRAAKERTAKCQSNGFGSSWATTA